MKINRGLKISLSVIIALVVVVSLIFSNVIPISYFEHINSTTAPISSNNTTSNISGNNTTSQNTTFEKTVNKPSSPLIGPVLIVNVKNYNYSYSRTLQLWANYYDRTWMAPQVLETNISHNGQYKFILPANIMLNVSRTDVEDGFGGANSFTSLILNMNQNIANPSASYYNNVQYCPYTLLHSATNMTVNGNLTYLDQHFSGTNVYPSAYSEVSFVNYTLSTTIWAIYP